MKLELDGEFLSFEEWCRKIIISLRTDIPIDFNVINENKKRKQYRGIKFYKVK